MFLEYSYYLILRFQIILGVIMKSYILLICMLSSPAFSSIICDNLNHKVYNSNPHYFAPKDSLGEHFKVWKGDRLIPIPDIKPECLPLALRYNNPGALKTPRKFMWDGQVGKDEKGHAIFKSTSYGVKAWIKWMSTKFSSGKDYSIFSIISIYAPPDDCVGSIGTPPNNCKFGLNPTATYAEKIAKNIKMNPNSTIIASRLSTDEKNELYYSIFKSISTFEIGSDFCGRTKTHDDKFCIFSENEFLKILNGDG
jgi:hypothetical protein